MRREPRGDLGHVGRPDVPLVRARMHGDARRAGRDARLDRVRSTLGTAPPRELRSVATLLTLTDSEIMRDATASLARTASAISSAHAWTDA